MHQCVIQKDKNNGLNNNYKSIIGFKLHTFIDKFTICDTVVNLVGYVAKQSLNFAFDCKQIFHIGEFSVLPIYYFFEGSLFINAWILAEPHNI